MARCKNMAFEISYYSIATRKQTTTQILLHHIATLNLYIVLVPLLREINNISRR